jgi:RNA polymerase sigma-70 factor (ECF subfamily)
MSDEKREDIYERNRQALPHIQAYLRGDGSAFYELVRLFGKNVTRLIHKMVYSHHDAEDLYNEIWLKVAQRLHQFDQSLPFHSWLYRISSNACIDFLRKRKDHLWEDQHLHAHIHKEARDGMQTPEEEVLQREEQQLLRQMLMQLEETDRLILSLRYTDDLTYDEIAEMVGMNKNTIGTRLFRAKKQLKELYRNVQQERRTSDASY